MVDVSVGGEVRILRPGLITPEMLERVLAAPVKRAEAAAPGAVALPSPGLLEVHYAPSTMAVLVSAREAKSLLDQRGDRVVVISCGEAVSPHDITLPRDATGYAAGLYAALREADRRGAELIAVIRPDASHDPELWAAVMDRLSRATAR